MSNPKYDRKSSNSGHINDGLLSDMDTKLNRLMHIILAEIPVPSDLLRIYPLSYIPSLLTTYYCELSKFGIVLTLLMSLTSAMMACMDAAVNRGKEKKQHHYLSTIAVC